MLKHTDKKVQEGFPPVSAEIKLRFECEVEVEVRIKVKKNSEGEVVLKNCNEPFVSITKEHAKEI